MENYNFEVDEDTMIVMTMSLPPSTTFIQKDFQVKMKGILLFAATI
jgi:hypothetical protein